MPWLVLGPRGPSEAGAAHPTGGSTHQYFLHFSAAGHGLLDEDYCAESIDGSDAFFLALVRNTLVLDFPHWDQTGSGKLDLWATPLACNSYADKSWIEVEFWANQEWTSVCGTDYSCVEHYEPVAGYHHRKQIVYVDTQHIDGRSSEYHQLISHEFGHVLGLSDPGGSCNPPPGGSIMHTFTEYGCPYQEFPTLNDVLSVDWNVMPLEY